MNDILEKVMNFINENTMTLIIICIFLILVLIGYLIDNSIKTRKLEKEEKLKNREKELEEKSNVETKVEPIQEPIVDNSIEEKVEEVKEEPIEVKQINPEVTPVLEEKVIEEIKEDKIDDETAKMEELLNKDFSNNNVDDIEITPDVNLDTVINKKEKVEEVKEVKEEPVKVEETPVVSEEPKSIYKSNKNLADIFGKKQQTSNIEETNRKLETTQDYSNELDRILAKINDEEKDYSKDSTLDETQEFSDRF